MQSLISGLSFLSLLSYYYYYYYSSYYYYYYSSYYYYYRIIWFKVQVGLLRPRSSLMISNKEQFGRQDCKDGNDDNDDHQEALSQSPTTLVWDQEHWIGRTGSNGNVVISMQIQGDSLSCTQWLNGLWFPQKSPHAKNVIQMQTVLSFLWKTEKIQPKIPSCNFFRWGPQTLQQNCWCHDQICHDS